jgi:hypothetical protein
VYSYDDTAHTGGVASNNTPCSVYATDDIVEAYGTINNVSLTNQLLTVNFSGLSYVLLGDTGISNDVDFSASTVATNTRCEPITTACNVSMNQVYELESSNDTILTNEDFPPFNCSTGFSGPTLAGIGKTVNPSFTYFDIEFFNDSALIEHAQLDTYPVNPTYFGFAVNIGGLGGIGVPSPPIFEAANDTEIIQGEWGFGYIIKCKVTVYDAHYTWINGTFNNFTSLTPTNGTMAGDLMVYRREIVRVPGKPMTTATSQSFVQGREVPC